MRKYLKPLLIASVTVALGYSAFDWFKSEGMTEKPAPAHHLSDGSFRNPPGSPKSSATFTDMVKFITQQIFNTKVPNIPDDHVLYSTRSQTEL